MSTAANGHKPAICHQQDHLTELLRRLESHGRTARQCGQYTLANDVRAACTLLRVWQIEEQEALHGGQR
jgi:hypothetical protein